MTTAMCMALCGQLICTPMMVGYTDDSGRYSLIETSEQVCFPQVQHDKCLCTKEESIEWHNTHIQECKVESVRCSDQEIMCKETVCKWKEK